MLLEYIKKRWETDRGPVAFLTGFLFSAVAIVISKLLFNNTPHLIGITTIFFTVIITMPVLNYILKEQEKIEKRKGHFFRKNIEILDFYIYFFIGVFALFFIASLVDTNYVFSKEDYYDIKEPSFATNLPPPTPNNSALLERIIKNNIYIVIVAFLLSLLFGAGSIFLIILNASMGAAAIIKYINLSGGTIFCNVGTFFIHYIPEMIGFLIAAIAGGLLAVDFAKEKLFSKSFIEVLSDSGKLLALATSFIIIAALLEVFISAKLFNNNFCMMYPWVLPTIFGVLVAGIVIFERNRKK